MARPVSPLLLALALAAAPAAFAAQRSPVAEAITVDLVEVDVHVTDRDGRAVAGLEREAFSLVDDGRPAAITHFAWVPPFGADREARAATGEPRRIALLFDDLQAGERSRAPLLASFYRELSRHLAPDDLVSVVRFDGANLDVLLDGSDDRRRLTAALEELIGYSGGQVRAALELRHAIGLLRHSVEDDPQTCSQTGQLVRQYAQIVKTQVEASAGGLLRYAQRFGEQPGRRVLLHVSGGIPLIAGDDALAWAAERCDASAIARGISGPTPPTLDGGGVNESRGYWNPKGSRIEIAEFSTAELWRNVAARVNTLGITLYPVLFGDAESRFRDEQRGGAMTPTAAFAARANSRDTLSFLADSTGGLMIDAVADLGGGMQRLAADLGGYYSLAFTPDPNGRAGVRPIRIAVARDGVALRHRESYRLESRDERIGIQLAELLAGERLDDPLGLSVTVLPAVEPDSARLRVVVPFDNLALIATPDGENEGRFTVYLAVRRAGGRLLAPRQRSVVVRRADLATPGYTYDVALPAAAIDVAVAIADDHSGAVGFARQRLAVP